MKPAIVIQTDFTKGTATSTMEGVINLVDPELRTFDCNQYVTSFNTYEASSCLNYVVPFWKPGTIFISVVDPGVGTDRRACVALLKNGSYVVTPDNGTLTHMVREIGVVEVRSIDESRHRLESTRAVSIFHGRDIFAYCAAKLASGIISFDDVGPTYPVNEIVIHDIPEPHSSHGVISGAIQSTDAHFGLVDSNIPYHMLEDTGIEYGDELEVIVRRRDEIIYTSKLTYQRSFAYVPEGEPLVMISETQHLQIAKNLRNITSEYGIECGPEWMISFTIGQGKKVQE